MIIDFYTHAFPDAVAAKAIPALAEEQAARMLNDYLLFGSNSPWDNQSEAIQRLKKMNLSPERVNRILRQNGERLLQ
jgi:predicted TIM-barrel fold metal-dependent hydrolase